MSLWRRLAEKPELLHRPGLLARRVWYPLLRRVAPERTILLPWGAPLRVSLREVIGHSAYIFGCYELPVCELLWRLADPGDTVLDIGANVGQMSSLLARRVGPQGRVHAFEPHPVVSQRLRANIELWRQRLGWTHVTLHTVALTDHSGQAALFDGAQFDGNEGTASLEATNGGEAPSHMVECRRLDEMMQQWQGPAPTLAKIDVEGHELKVLLGGEGGLDRGQPRDIVFEEQNAYPSPVTHLLESKGYSLFTVRRDTWCPRVGRPVIGHQVQSGWEWTSFVATLDAERFLLRMARGGWRVLSGAAARGDNVEVD